MQYIISSKTTQMPISTPRNVPVIPQFASPKSGYGIKIKAATSLTFDLHCKAIAASFFTPYYRCLISGHWHKNDTDYECFMFKIVFLFF